MNEYRWYPNEQKPVNTNEKTENFENIRSVHKKNHTVLYAVLASAGISLCGIVISAILAFAINQNTQPIVHTTIDDGRAKTDISAVINPSDNGMLSVSGINETVSSCVVGIVNKGALNGFLTQDMTLGSGSGVIIGSDGYIATNNHVIEAADNLYVILKDGTEYPARVVGGDERTDLAVLKINASELPSAVLGDSNAVKVGELAVAIGNPLGQELAGSVTAGVISAVDRVIEVEGKKLNLLQTDAAINPGNSGGALVNCYGEVIGINTVKVSSTSIEGIGFAIPINEAKPILEELISNGRVTGRPRIGITGYDAPYGVEVKSVEAGSAAETAGLKEGDLIIKFNGTSVKTVAEINELKEKFNVGDKVTLTLYRDGELTDVDLILTEE